MNKYKFRSIFRAISMLILIAFTENVCLPQYLPKSLASNMLGLPIPGVAVALSPSFTPAILRGLQVFAKDPLKLSFIVDHADSGLKGEDFEKEAEKLINYFLAALTFNEKDLWVNLSPYEKDRIIPDDLAKTEMGRDMLAQDYLLKQVTASLIHPESKIGKQFWQRVYQQAYEQYGTTEIPIDTFNKVWIIPQKAKVYVKNDRAFVIESSLKVMLEEDYVATQQSRKPQVVSDKNENFTVYDLQLTAKIVREILIPELEKEVNEGKNFAELRQIYHAMILATWFKDRLKESIVNQIYANQGKIKGVDLVDSNVTQQIYQKYLAAFKKGVCDFIKLEHDPYTKKNIPKKYFSGGIEWVASSNIEYVANISSQPPVWVSSSSLEGVDLNLKPIFDSDFESENISSADVLGIKAQEYTPADLKRISKEIRLKVKEIFGDDFYKWVEQSKAEKGSLEKIEQVVALLVGDPDFIEAIQSSDRFHAEILRYAVKNKVFLGSQGGFRTFLSEIKKQLPESLKDKALQIEMRFDEYAYFIAALEHPEVRAFIDSKEFYGLDEYYRLAILLQKMKSFGAPFREHGYIDNYFRILPAQVTEKVPKEYFLNQILTAADALVIKRDIEDNPQMQDFLRELVASDKAQDQYFDQVLNKASELNLEISRKKLNIHHKRFITELLKKIPSEEPRLRVSMEKVFGPKVHGWIRRQKVATGKGKKTVEVIKGLLDDKAFTSIFSDETDDVLFAMISYFIKNDIDLYISTIRDLFDKLHEYAPDEIKKYLRSRDTKFVKFADFVYLRSALIYPNITLFLNSTAFRDEMKPFRLLELIKRIKRLAPIQIDTPEAIYNCLPSVLAPNVLKDRDIYVNYLTFEFGDLVYRALEDVKFAQEFKTPRFKSFDRVKKVLSLKNKLLRKYHFLKESNFSIKHEQFFHQIIDYLDMDSFEISQLIFEIFGLKADAWAQSHKGGLREEDAEKINQAAEALVQDEIFKEILNDPKQEIPIWVIRRASENNIILGTSNMQTFLRVLRTKLPEQAAQRLRLSSISVSDYMHLIAGLNHDSVQKYLRSTSFKSQPEAYRLALLFDKILEVSFIGIRDLRNISEALPHHMADGLTRDKVIRINTTLDKAQKIIATFEDSTIKHFIASKKFSLLSDEEKIKEIIDASRRHQLPLSEVEILPNVEGFIFQIINRGRLGKVSIKDRIDSVFESEAFEWIKKQKIMHGSEKQAIKKAERIWEDPKFLEIFNQTSSHAYAFEMIQYFVQNRVDIGLFMLENIIRAFRATAPEDFKDKFKLIHMTLSDYAVLMAALSDQEVLQELESEEFQSVPSYLKALRLIEIVRDKGYPLRTKRLSCVYQALPNQITPKILKKQFETIFLSADQVYQIMKSLRSQSVRKYLHSKWAKDHENSKESLRLLIRKLRREQCPWAQGSVSVQQRRLLLKFLSDFKANGYYHAAGFALKEVPQDDFKRIISLNGRARISLGNRDFSTGQMSLDNIARVVNTVVEEFEKWMTENKDRNNIDNAYINNKPRVLVAYDQDSFTEKTAFYIHSLLNAKGLDVNIVLDNDDEDLFLIEQTKKNNDSGCDLGISVRLSRASPYSWAAFFFDGAPLPQDLKDRIDLSLQNKRDSKDYLCDISLLKIPSYYRIEKKDISEVVSKINTDIGVNFEHDQGYEQAKGDKISSPTVDPAQTPNRKISSSAKRRDAFKQLDIKDVNYYILDLDGVILNTEEFNRDPFALVYSMVKNGVMNPEGFIPGEADMEEGRQFQESHVGQSTGTVLKQLIASSFAEKFPSEMDVDSFVDGLYKIYQKARNDEVKKVLALPKAQVQQKLLKPGVLEFLKDKTRQGATLWVLTGGKKEDKQPILERLGLLDNFKGIHFSGTREKKIEIFKEMIKEIDPEENVIIVDDSAKNIQEFKSILAQNQIQKEKIYLVGLTEGNQEKEEKMNPSADGIVMDLGNLVVSSNALRKIGAKISKVAKKISKKIFNVLPRSLKPQPKKEVLLAEVSLGKTGKKFFPLGLGTARFGGYESPRLDSEKYLPPTQETVDELMLTASKEMRNAYGAVMLDTANQYFESEEMLGKFFAKNPELRKNFYIATKWGLTPDVNYKASDYSEENLRRSVKQSLAHLKRVELLYIQFNSLQSDDEFLQFIKERKSSVEAMKKMRSEKYGGIRHLGVSISDSSKLKIALDQGLLDEMDVVQTNTDTFINYPDLIKEIEEKGIGIVVNASLSKPVKDGGKELVREEIYSKLLKRKTPPIILSGTLNKKHLSENVDLVKSTIDTLGKENLGLSLQAYRKDDAIWQAESLIEKALDGKNVQEFYVARDAFEQITGGKVVAFSNSEKASFEGIDILSRDRLEKRIEELLDIFPADVPYNRFLAKKILTAFQLCSGFARDNIVSALTISKTEDGKFVRISGVRLKEKQFIFSFLFSGGSGFVPPMQGAAATIPLDRDIRGKQPADQEKDIVENLGGVIGGSGNVLQRIVLPDGKFAMRKIAFKTAKVDGRTVEVDVGKLRGEIEVMKRERARGKPYPEIYEDYEDSEKIVVVMEDFGYQGYFPVTSLSHWNSANIEGNNLSGVSAETIWKFGLKVYQDQMDLYKQKVGEGSEDFVINLFNKKLSPRLEVTKKNAPVLAEMLDAPIVGVVTDSSATQYLPGLETFKPFVIALAKAGFLFPPYLSKDHGDLNYGNILAKALDIVYYGELRDYKLIDPKDSPQGNDYLYDLAKLLHNFLGKYDLGRLEPAYGFVPYKGRAEGVPYFYEDIDDEYINPVPLITYDRMTTEFYKWLEQTDDFFGLEKGEQWKIRLIFTVGAMMIGLPPFHLQHDGVESRSRTFYITGLQLMHAAVSFLMEDEDIRLLAEGETPGIARSWQILKSRLQELQELDADSDVDPGFGSLQDKEISSSAAVDQQGQRSSESTTISSSLRPLSEETKKQIAELFNEYATWGGTTVVGKTGFFSFLKEKWGCDDKVFSEILGVTRKFVKSLIEIRQAGGISVRNMYAFAERFGFKDADAAIFFGFAKDRKDVEPLTGSMFNLLVENKAEMPKVLYQKAPDEKEQGFFVFGKNGSADTYVPLTRTVSGASSNIKGDDDLPVNPSTGKTDLRFRKGDPDTLEQKINALQSAVDHGMYYGIRFGVNRLLTAAIDSQENPKERMQALESLSQLSLSQEHIDDFLFEKSKGDKERWLAQTAGDQNAEPQLRALCIKVLAVLAQQLGSPWAYDFLEDLARPEATETNVPVQVQEALDRYAGYRKFITEKDMLMPDAAFAETLVQRIFGNSFIEMFMAWDKFVNQKLSAVERQKNVQYLIAIAQGKGVEYEDTDFVAEAHSLLQEMSRTTKRKLHSKFKYMAQAYIDKAPAKPVMRVIRGSGASPSGLKPDGQDASSNIAGKDGQDNQDFAGEKSGFVKFPKLRQTSSDEFSLTSGLRYLREENLGLYDELEKSALDPTYEFSEEMKRSTHLLTVNLFHADGSMKALGREILIAVYNATELRRQFAENVHVRETGQVTISLDENGKVLSVKQGDSALKGQVKAGAEDVLLNIDITDHGNEFYLIKSSFKSFPYLLGKSLEWVATGGLWIRDDISIDPGPGRKISSPAGDEASATQSGPRTFLHLEKVGRFSHVEGLKKAQEIINSHKGKKVLVLINGNQGSGKTRFIRGELMDVLGEENAALFEEDRYPLGFSEYDQNLKMAIKLIDNGLERSNVLVYDGINSFKIYKKVADQLAVYQSGKEYVVMNLTADKTDPSRKPDIEISYLQVREVSGPTVHSGQVGEKSAVNDESKSIISSAIGIRMTQEKFSHNLGRPLSRDEWALVDVLWTIVPTSNEQNQSLSMWQWVRNQKIFSKKESRPRSIDEDILDIFRKMDALFGDQAEQKEKFIAQMKGYVHLYLEKEENFEGLEPFELLKMVLAQANQSRPLDRTLIVLRDLIARGLIKPEETIAGIAEKFHSDPSQWKDVPDQSSKKKSISGRKPVVLLVDDKLGQIRELKVSLENAGYEVDFVVSAQTGLKKIKQFIPDLIVTDWEMSPFMDGITFVKSLKNSYPDIPVVFRSSDVGNVHDSHNMRGSFILAAFDNVVAVSGKFGEEDIALQKIKEFLKISSPVGGGADLSQGDDKISSAAPDPAQVKGTSSSLDDEAQERVTKGRGIVLDDSPQSSEQEASFEAKKYLKSLGMDFDLVGNQPTVDYFFPISGAELGEDKDFKERMIAKILELARMLDKTIAIHVLAAERVVRMTEFRHTGHAMIIKPGFLELIKKKHDEDLKKRASLVEGPVSTEKEVAEIFLKKFIKAVSETFHYGYRIEDKEPSVPVTIFVDYDSGLKEQQRVTRDDYLFPYTTFALDFNDPAQFQRRILNLVQWHSAEISVKDKDGVLKGRPYVVIDRLITERYLDALIQIAKKSLRDLPTEGEDDEQENADFAQRKSLVKLASPHNVVPKSSALKSGGEPLLFNGYQIQRKFRLPWEEHIDLIKKIDPGPGFRMIDIGVGAQSARGILAYLLGAEVIFVDYNEAGFKLSLEYALRDVKNEDGELLKNLIDQKEKKEKFIFLPQEIQTAIRHESIKGKKFDAVFLENVLDQPFLNYPEIARSALSLLKEDGGFLYVTKLNNLNHAGNGFSVLDQDEGKDPVAYIKEIALNEFDLELNEHPGDRRILISSRKISSNLSPLPNGEQEYGENKYRMLSAGKIKGGIDFDRDNWELENKGEGIEFEVPAELQGIDFSRVEGFVPMIINITPVTNVWTLMGLNKEDYEDSEFVQEIQADESKILSYKL